jgi:hypothetical protein
MVYQLSNQHILRPQLQEGLHEQAFLGSASHFSSGCNCCLSLAAKLGRRIHGLRRFSSCCFFLETDKAIIKKAGVVSPPHFPLFRRASALGSFLLPLLSADG